MSPGPKSSSDEIEAGNNSTNGGGAAVELSRAELDLPQGGKELDSLNVPSEENGMKGNVKRKAKTSVAAPSNADEPNGDLQANLENVIGPSGTNGEKEPELNGGDKKKSVNLATDLSKAKDTDTAKVNSNPSLDRRKDFAVTPSDVPVSQSLSASDASVPADGSQGTDARSKEAPIPSNQSANVQDDGVGDMNDAMLAQLEAMNRLLMSDEKATYNVSSKTLREPNSLERTKHPPDQDVQSEDWDFWSAAIADFDVVAKKQPKVLLRKIEAGIPSSLRGMVWQLIAKSKNSSLEADYATLLKTTSPYEKLILRDLSRTFPTHEHFRDKEGDGQTSLYNIIKAYSILDPEVGYCQGLSFVAGPLLLNLPDEEAFCLLVMLLKSPGPYCLRDHYTPTMAGLQLRLYQFDRLLQEIMPNLHKHLSSQGVRCSMYASQWFMTLFAYNCPMPLVYRVFDSVLFEGPSSLLRFALAVMRKSETHLLTLHFEQIMDYLKTGLSKQYDGNPTQFVTDAMSFKEVTPRKLEKLSKEHANELKKMQSRGTEFGFFSPIDINSSLGNAGQQQSSTYSSALYTGAAYLFSKASRRNADGPIEGSDTPGTPSSLPDEDMGMIRFSSIDDISPTDLIRRLEAERIRLDAAITATNQKNVALATDLVAAQLAIAREQDFTEALHRQVTDLKRLLSTERSAAEEMVREQITALEKRAAALERRAIQAEEKAASVESELVNSKLAFAESENSRMQLERRWNELKKAMGS